MGRKNLRVTVFQILLGDIFEALLTEVKIACDGHFLGPVAHVKVFSEGISGKEGIFIEIGMEVIF